MIPSRDKHNAKDCRDKPGIQRWTESVTPRSSKIKMSVLRTQKNTRRVINTTTHWMSSVNKQGVTVEVTKGSNSSSNPRETQFVGDVVKLRALEHRRLRSSRVPPLALHPAGCTTRRNNSRGQNEPRYCAKPHNRARKRHSFGCFFCCQISSGCFVTLRK